MALLAISASALGAAIGCDGGTSVVTSSATGASGEGGGTGGAGGEEPIGGEPVWIVESGSGGCDTIVYDPPNTASPHVEECSVLEHLSNPPTTGPHYPRWADYRTYVDPVPRGFYLHAMEHGGVVIAYDCSTPCDAEVMAIDAFVAGLMPDPACTGASPVRIVVTPDPLLDVRIAVAAWGHMLKARCFDAARVASFVAAHYAAGSEDTCAAGIDPTDPNAMLPPGCGQ